MKKYDDTVPLPTPPDDEYLKKQYKALKKALEYIQDIGNLNLVQPAAFSVHKDGSDQAGIVTSTFTLITWPAEIFDINSEFASNKWTPSARVVRMTACLRFNDVADGAAGTVALYKNGSLFKVGGLIARGASGDHTAVGTWIDKANGTDYYEIYGWHDHGSDRDISGSSIETYFMGH